MGKQGPCCHCGVTSTPLWRNGPPEKPVLCNACGSRWRTKGSLANYTPLHARSDLDEYEDHRVSRMKSIFINKSKDIKLFKRKPNHDNGAIFPEYSHSYRKVLEEDASNRSSSGSAISNSESCVQLGSVDPNWDSSVPSKKRSCVNRPKQSSVEKLTKDLYAIWHEQQSLCFSGSSEEDLLFESEGPMVSVEIGHGSVLIRHPSSIARDEESEASSLSVENKVYAANEAYSAFPENKNVNIPSPEKELKRDQSQHERTQVLVHRDSPLCDIDLNDIINFEGFARCLTKEEQQNLLKYLPPLDTTRFPDSIKSMFNSPQFKDNISCYQQLLGEGVYDLSFAGAGTEDCKTLKRLTLTNLSKSKWVEYYHQLQKCGKSPVGREPNPNVVTSRSRDSQGQKHPEVKMKSPKRVNTKGAYDNREMESEGSCFSPKSLFALPADGGSLMLDSLHYMDDQDLLVEVPSNGLYPQAELLKLQPSTSSSSAYPPLFCP